jgi:hypothetical protein
MVQAAQDRAAGDLPGPLDAARDPDGAEIVNGVADRVRAELLRSIGLTLHPHLG